MMYDEKWETAYFAVNSGAEIRTHWWKTNTIHHTDHTTNLGTDWTTNSTFSQSSSLFQFYSSNAFPAYKLQTVQAPHRTYVRALAYYVLLMPLTYVLEHLMDGRWPSLHLMPMPFISSVKTNRMKHGMHLLF